MTRVHGIRAPTLPPARHMLPTPPPSSPPRQPGLGEDGGASELSMDTEPQVARRENADGPSNCDSRSARLDPAASRPPNPPAPAACAPACAGAATPALRVHSTARGASACERPGTRRGCAARMLGPLSRCAAAGAQQGAAGGPKFSRLRTSAGTGEAHGTAADPGGCSAGARRDSARPPAPPALAAPGQRWRGCRLRRRAHSATCRPAGSGGGRSTLARGVPRPL